MSFSRKGKALVAGMLVAFAIAEPAMAADAADPLAQAADFIKRGVVIVLGVISAVIFAIAAYGVITKLGEAASGKGQWGAVALPFIVGAIAAMFVGYLYTQGIAAADQIGTAGLQVITQQAVFAV